MGIVVGGCFCGDFVFNFVIFCCFGNMVGVLQSFVSLRGSYVQCLQFLILFFLDSSLFFEVVQIGRKVFFVFGGNVGYVV